ncbi:MAG: hypothetical protein QOC59_1062 [Microbacteriaceae bacterium]|nr:hypothetical protein [Microbacteriaceae bacterium]
MRGRGRLAAIAAAALALATVPVLPAVGAGVGTPAISVAPDRGGVLRSGDSLGVSVAITNPGTAALAPGTVRIALDKLPVVSVSTLLDRIGDPGGALLGYLVATVRSPAVASGETVRVHVNLSRAVLDGVLGSSTGTRVLGAELDTGSVEALANSAVTRIGTGFRGRVQLGTVVPLTAPANMSGLVDAAGLATLTAPSGAWSQALAAAQAYPGATLALDPEVQASIRAAGASAPDSAKAFLDDLAALPNETIRLPYADADVTLERAAGAGRIAGPTSFAGGGEAAPTPTATPGSSASPTPTPSASRLPNRAELLRWSYSRVAVGWPVPGTVTAADLGFLRTSGYPVALLSSGDVADTKARVTAGPLARIGSSRVLVADSTASRLLTTAAGTPGVPADAALAELIGVLGTDALTGEASTVLAAAGRDPGARAGLARVLGLLAEQEWIRGTTLQTLTSAAAPATVALKPGVVPPARVAAARSAFQGEAAVRHLGASAQNGAALTGPQRLGLLAVLSAAWRADDRGFATAVHTVTQAFSAFVGKVAIDRASPITYVGGSGSLPVTVTNGLTEPVRVLLTGVASNGRLRVEGSETVVLPAQGGARAKLPVRSISNGEVDVTLTLKTMDGRTIGKASKVRITVNAGWEAIGAVIFAAALLALFGTGVYRNVRRARRSMRARS